MSLNVIMILIFLLLIIALGSVIAVLRGDDQRWFYLVIVSLVLACILIFIAIIEVYKQGKKSKDNGYDSELSDLDYLAPSWLSDEDLTDYDSDLDWEKFKLPDDRKERYDLGRQPINVQIGNTLAKDKFDQGESSTSSYLRSRRDYDRGYDRYRYDRDRYNRDRYDRDRYDRYDRDRFDRYSY